MVSHIWNWWKRITLCTLNMSIRNRQFATNDTHWNRLKSLHPYLTTFFPQFLAFWFYFWYSLLPRNTLANSRRWLKDLCSCHQCRRPRWNSKILTSIWFSPTAAGIQEMNWCIENAPFIPPTHAPFQVKKKCDCYMPIILQQNSFKN